MKKTLSLGAAALMLALAYPAAAEQSAAAANKTAAKPANGTLAKVNGTAIPMSLSDFIVKEQVSQGAKADDQLRANVKDHLVRREILLQEARRSGAEKDPAVRQRMEFARDEQLINAYIQTWMKKHPVSDAQAKAEYDKQVRALGDTEYKVRHILVENEDVAKALIQKLQGGAKFADLAKDSKDPGSKDKGGDLGWARSNTYVPEFAQAVAKLAKGKYTTAPVKTQFGYHVIQLDDSRKVKNPKFEEVKPQLTRGMQQEVLQKHIAELVSKAKVE